MFTYDDVWDAQLQSEYKAGKRSLKANRFAGTVAVPKDQSFITLPDSGGKPHHAALAARGAELLRQGKLGLIHLNGGLATRFGQIKATHEVAEFSSRRRTFLELKIGHLLWVSKTYGGNVPYGLMNSPMTDPVTREFLAQNRMFGLHEDRVFSYVQNVLRRKIPRREDAETFLSSLGADAAPLRRGLDVLRGREGEFLEDAWAPAGHFDAVAALVMSRTIGKFLKAGVEYVQISNIDNLAATVDPAILGILAQGAEDMLVEVALKKPGDRGGIPVLLPGKGTVLLEEFALPESFDGSAVRQFNTATYWIKLDGVLKIFGLTPDEADGASAAVLAERVREVRRRIPAYVILKKAEIPDVGETLVEQDEQLLGDLTRLYLENTGKSPAYLLIDTAKRFIPVKTKEDLGKEESRIRAVLENCILLR